MSGLFQLTVQEQRGAVAVLADLDNTAIVMGVCSGLTGLSAFYLSASSAIAGVGYGDAPDAGTQIIEQRLPSGVTSPKRPAAFYGTGTGTPGSYGTVDNTGVTGTGLGAVDATVVPRGTFEARLKVVNGFTVGTTGGTFQVSLAADRGYGNTIALGVADNYTIPNSGVKFVLTPSAASLTALYTKVTLLQTTLTGTGHFTITSGGTPVHASADTADDTALAAVPAATTPASGVTLFNACLSYLGIHGASAVYHTGADAPLATALAAIPVAANIADVDLHLPALIAAYNAHRINTASVHGSADATNTITAYVSAPATFSAGDVIAVRTFAPAPGTSDVDAAFVALAASSARFSLLVLEFPVNAAMAAHVTTGLNLLETTGRYVTVITRARLPDFENAETEAAWAASIALDIHNFSDSRIHRREEYFLVTDAATGAQYLRSDLAQFAADVVRVPRKAWPDAPADLLSGMPNASLINAAGATVGHDEGPRGNVTGLSDDTQGNRGGCVQRIGDQTSPEAVYATVPWVLYGAGEQTKNIMVRRILNAMKREAVTAGKPSYGATVPYIAADPNTPGSLPTLTDVGRNMLHGAIYNRLAVEFVDDIQNAGDAALDTGLVQVSQTIVVSGGNLLAVTVTIAPKMLGYVVKETFNLAVQQ